MEESSGPFEKPQLRSYDPNQRIETAIKWILGVLLFIVVIIYAGIRGTLAYNHQPALLVNFQQRASVNFPAVTICPMEPTTLSLVECVKETGSNDVADCSSTQYFRMFSLEGMQYGCLTFNDPQDGSKPLASNSYADELEIQVRVNISLVPVGEGSGVLVILHDQMTEPELEEESSFIANVGEMTETFLRLDEIHYINGTVENDFKSFPSGSELREDIQGSLNNLAAVALYYTQQGAFVNQEYYVYTPDNWIGEVGGLTCLLWFLHWFVTSVIILAVRKMKGVNKLGYNSGANL